MRFITSGHKKEMNSYPTLQDEKTAVEQFLNREAQEALLCLDTQGLHDDPLITPDEVPTANTSNPHDQIVDQVPYTYQALKYSTPKSYLSCCPAFAG